MTEAAGEIRRAVAAECTGIAQILNTWIDRTPWMVRLYSAAQIERMIQKSFPRRVIWVVGEPVSAYLSFDPPTARVVALYCACPGQGVGKALLDRAREGCDHLWLTTYAPNLAAQRFYRREGFAQTQRLHPQPSEVLAEIRMDWWR